MIATNQNDRRAVAYLRVSGMAQVSGDGFPRQSEAISRYAESAGLELVAVFTDGGVSGTVDADDRAGMAALLEYCQEQGVQVALVEKADRLARDLLTSEVALAKFRSRGIDVRSADGADLTVADCDPMRTLVRQILGVIAEFDRRMIVRRLHDARARKRRSGQRCEGRLPFGAYPGEEATLRRILAMSGGGMQPGAIAEALNAEGLRTRSGKPWIRQVVGPIVKRSVTGLFTVELASTG